MLPALLWQFDRYTLSTRVNVRFKHEGIESRRFSPDLETAAYRVTQESLTNVARHAAVDSVCVQIRADRQNLQVRIRDEGSGFDSERKRYKSDGCGMLGMSERVQLLRGRFHVASRPGDGTSIEADFPLQLPDVPVFPTTNSGQK